MNTTPKILVVDDNERMGRMFKIVLKEEGIDVHHVLSGHEAIQKLKNGPYDFVFIDAVMPGLGGIDAIKKIREFNTGISIILITGYYGKDTMHDNIKELNVLTVMEKPITISQVVKIIKSGAGTAPENIPR